MPGVAELLETLRQRRIGVGIVTRNCAAAVRRMFPQVEQYCQAFLPRDQVTQVKPHPGHLQIALTRLGSAPSRTIMVGDGVLDIQAGKALGMFSVGVLTGETPWTSFWRKAPIWCWPVPRICCHTCANAGGYAA